MSGDNHRHKRAQHLPRTPGQGDPGAEAHASLEAEQTLSDLDQTLSDSDQTASDSDQRTAEADQEVADSDQRASIRDQAAAHRDREHGSRDSAVQRAYEASRAEGADASTAREVSATARAATAVAHTQQAIQRDEAARMRDVNALARDRAADARDRAAERKEASLGNGAAPDPEVTTLKESAATVRARAASDRARAAADRARAAADRARAADDRRQARIDLRAAHLDDLTGVYTRGLGLLTLQHEIDRAHRSGEPFVLAFIDVDGLKQVNDRNGHAAGDALLRAVAAELRSKLRSYDPIVRIGGDEFICALSNTNLEAATGRVAEISAALEEKQVDSSISAGLAELSPGESLEHLTARGDAELYRVKHSGQLPGAAFTDPSH